MLQSLQRKKETIKKVEAMKAERKIEEDKAAALDVEESVEESVSEEVIPRAPIFSPPPVVSQRGETFQGFDETAKSVLQTLATESVPRIVVESLLRELHHASSASDRSASPSSPAIGKKQCQHCSNMCGIASLTCKLLKGGCGQRPFLKCEVDSCEKNAASGSKLCKKCLKGRE
ncbi:hypothetical protein TrLO_g3901 [Triparma laevis f. longispina]|nr:hypothetical protein TrLO_g3901 [Triparma laevis f. longispina]